MQHDTLNILQAATEANTTPTLSGFRHSARHFAQKGPTTRLWVEATRLQRCCNSFWDRFRCPAIHPSTNTKQPTTFEKTLPLTIKQGYSSQSFKYGDEYKLHIYALMQYRNMLGNILTVAPTIGSSTSFWIDFIIWFGLVRGRIIIILYQIILCCHTARVESWSRGQLQPLTQT